MAEVRPFCGLRFRKDAAPDMADLLCPPYDIISAEEQRKLHQRSPFNVVRLEYGETSAADTPADNRYTRAAATLSEWRQSGVLVQEEAPALYVYDQGFTHQGRLLTRRGLFARVRLHHWNEGLIRPHEHTMSGPKEDRLQLLRACRVNFSPILALYQDPDAAVRKTLEEARDPAPLYQTAELDGESSTLYDMDDRELKALISIRRQSDIQIHRLYPVTGRQDIDRIGELFQEENVYVIDGHHRYETALAYREERQAQSQSWDGEEGENFVLLTLVAEEDPGLVVLPTHRLLRSATLPADFVPRLEKVFNVEDVSGELGGENAWQRLEALLAKAGRDRIAFAVASREGSLRLIATVRDLQQVASLMPSDRPASWRSLDAAVLQQLVLEDILSIGERAAPADSAIEFIHDGDEALRLVDSGRCALAFFLNAMPTQRVLEVADAGERMPQKSSYFHPKLPTGLVMNPLD